MASKTPQEQQTTDTPAQKFHPTIFKYKCRGIFFLTSDEVGSNGVCHGIQSQLQHVRDLHPSSKEESIQNLLQDFPQQQQEQQQQESSTDSAILQVPAMIYKGVDEATTNSKKSQRLLNAIILSNNNISTMTMTNGMIGPVMELRKCGS